MIIQSIVSGRTSTICVTFSFRKVPHASDNVWLGLLESGSVNSNKGHNYVEKSLFICPHKFEVKSFIPIRDTIKLSDFIFAS